MWLYFKKFLVWLRAQCPLKNELNYLYFSSLLLFLSVLSLSHFLCLERPLLGIPLFFLLHSLGQAFLEVGIFALIAYLLKRWAPKWLHLLFIALSFSLLLVHFTDFTLLRLMDASLAYLFRFFLGGGFEHLILVFQALNLNATMIALIMATLFLVPISGIGFYWLTHCLARLKPLRVSFNQILTGLCCIIASLFILDFLAHPFLNRYMYAKYQKALPFGTTFMAPTRQCIALPASFSRSRKEEETVRSIPELRLATRPNIYFFVIETLRRDFINSEIAPHLDSFANNHIQFDSSFSNANSTHLSWFAIFHSNRPYHWTAMRDEWRTGSVPLQFFKKLGYRIKVYSSADLRYFNMDKLLFGENRQIVDQMNEYALQRGIEPCVRDALAIGKCSFDLRQEEARNGNVFVFFLDSTHSEYSFPSDFPLQFEPISKEIDYLTLHPKSKELELIKNRYRNSIYYVDRLIGDFFALLKKEDLFEEAIIAVTGDHGEEFFEEGALFHGTHLNRYQTSVPLFLKFPSKEWVPAVQEATHMDICPSILHYLTGQSDFSSLFDGQSVFSSNHWPYRIAVLHQGPDTPCEFLVAGKEGEFRARFINPADIYSDPHLEIIHIETSQPQSPDLPLRDQIEAHFPLALPSLLENK